MPTIRSVLTCICISVACAAPAWAQCPGAGGDCCVDDGTPGCDDVDCCNAICASDPFCCDTAWDSICVGEAQAEPLCDQGACVSGGCCGSPGTGDCCVDDGTPCCDDADCCNSVCASDPFCCDTAWDSICVGEAQADPLCDQGACVSGGCCGTPGTGDCCVDDGTPCCDDADCCNSVCASDPFCCDTAWDSICVGEAQADPLCDQGACGGGGTCVAEIDIKPGSCPNSFNRNNHGVLPVAIVGTATLNVADIDISSITLCRCDGVGTCVSPIEGPPGPHSTIADVATPFPGEACDCHDLTGDGIPDLVLHFDSQALVEALQLNDLPPGSLVELCICFSVGKGGQCCGSDCIRLVPPGAAGPVGAPVTGPLPPAQVKSGNAEE